MSGSEGGCHVSESSNYPLLAAQMLGVAGKDFACSGAAASDVTTTSQMSPPGQTVPPQISTLSGYEDTVVLTVGPDGLSCPNEDCRFASVFTRCVNVPIGNPNVEPCQPVLDPATNPQVTNAISNLEPTLVQTYLAIHQAAPTAQIYILGYPTLFASGLSGGTCDYINDSDIKWLLAKEAQLNGVVAQAVIDANMNAYGLIHFVDLAHAFDGHELCSGGTEWLYGIDVNPPPFPPESRYFHPTVAGQQQMAAYLASQVGHR